MQTNSVQTASVTTIYDNYATLCMKYKLAFTPDPNTTLNTKFNIDYANAPTHGYPEIKYLAIGNGGHSCITGNVNINGLIHSCTDSALKNQLPFLIVPANNDLTIVEMARYRLRVPLTIGGTSYIAYYLKVIDFPPMVVNFSTYTLNNGVVTNQAPYTPTLATQNPSMIDISNVSDNLVSGNHIATTINTDITLSTAEFQNIIEACTLLYGNPNTAVVSELGLISGFDIQAPITVSGVTTTYTEIQCAQVATFLSTLYAPASNPNPSLITGVSFGVSQPLLLIP
jgi:hypothetical protein